MHCGGRVVALLRQLHCLASCPLLRFSSASRRTLFRVRRIRPHRHTLRLVSPRHQIVRTIRPHRTAALASEAEAGGEEEAETEERRHHHRVRSWIREEYCMQLGRSHLCRLLRETKVILSSVVLFLAVPPPRCPQKTGVYIVSVLILTLLPPYAVALPQLGQSSYSCP